MDKKEFSWRDECKKFLLETDKYQVCMKFPDPKGGRPLHFGVIFPNDNLCKIFLRDKETMELTKEYKHYSSIDEMLDAGWDVD